MFDKVEGVFPAKATLGEGPHWDHDNHHLYWVDILEKKLHLFDPQQNQNHSVQFDQYIGAVVRSKSGQLLLAMENGIYQYDLQSQKLTFITNPEKNLSGNRFNDGKCDPAGRFWAGTMSLDETEGQGSLYRLDPSGESKKILSPVTISNGLAWSPDHSFMYYIDTPTSEVKMYQYDEKSGDIRFLKTSVSIPRSSGYPDGMTIDSDGMIWVAHWGGARVTRWDPQSGIQLDEISIPAKNVTSCTFGGANLDELYITTARIGMDEEELSHYPQSGNLFRVRTKAKGIPAYLYG
ncbi:SMP-30/gluconolactonase/LRE family protein [Alkalihalobacillus sp. MEB130]|uniref:SMP-30/gluconolactonase/LRE family protein n=1 Tax=Alkalihalobacillus sp. MEB130 TaxID=2976704 RepID=UPI0028DF76B7|nr:SMP-30/gluconolactonase/LRE family protein [Alkalihalobacillus sp. MEB130]MDT8862442.1 SMP-30/gluconolactonase/LRE family protein [Alkalihalobacillus sp. MEB130]